MSNKTITIVLAIVALGLIGFMATQTGSKNKNISFGENNISAIVYKSPSCGCCGVYISYMKNKKYNIETKNIENMSTIKDELGVPYELESCHTMEIEGYVVEGHIPEEAIEELLTQKPDIKGIGMAGMPSGSPGMPGPKIEDFVIYEITHEGTKGDIFMII